MACCCSCCSAVTTRCYSCKKRQRFRRKRKPSLCEKAWFVFLVFTFLISITNTFYWLSISNEANTLDKYVWDEIEIWLPVYTVFLAITCALFAYIAILLLVGILNMCMREYLQLHVIHKVLVSIVFVYHVTIMTLMSLLDPELWILIMRSIQFSGPFVHLVAVVFITIVTWFVAAGLGLLCERGITIRDLTVVYFIFLIGLYIVPIFINSPCILDYDKTPAKPLIFAHKGSEMVAPENTDIAFRLALDEYRSHGIESDVRISLDGIPYVMHDENLRRTTNVKDVFPQRYMEHADNFTMKELKELNAGSWFMEQDPFMTARSLTAEQKVQYMSQKVPTMQEMFETIRKRNKTLLFDVRPPPEDHPYSDSWFNVTLDVIRNMGIPDSEIDYWKAPNGPHYVIFITTFDKRSILNLQHTTPFKYIVSNATMNISTNVWVVNEKWLFSLFWCVGTSSVTSAASHTLYSVTAPSWQLSPDHYLIIWILFDVASLVWVVVLFIIQIRKTRKQNRLSRESEDC